MSVLIFLLLATAIVLFVFFPRWFNIALGLLIIVFMLLFGVVALMIAAIVFGIWWLITLLIGNK